MNIALFMCHREGGRILMEFDIGKAQQEAYEDGYIDGLTDFENKIDAELTKACWYNKGKFTGLVKRFKEEFKERVKGE